MTSINIVNPLQTAFHTVLLLLVLFGRSCSTVNFVIRDSAKDVPEYLDQLNLLRGGIPLTLHAKEVGSNGHAFQQTKYPGRLSSILLSDEIDLLIYSDRRARPNSHGKNCCDAG
jgi:hypothetical protein